MAKRDTGSNNQEIIKQLFSARANLVLSAIKKYVTAEIPT